MIESFKHKGLRNLFEQDDAGKVKGDQVDRLRLILSTLDQASDVQDMAAHVSVASAQGQPQRRLGSDGKGELAGDCSF
jgi:plasmid maintenance system killer protein